MGTSLNRGINDLATTHPELAAQWHPSMNGELTPQDVVAGTEKKIWWRCELGHEWLTTGATRLRGGGCPICRNKLVLNGFNDLATTHPELAVQWHPSKNGELTPQVVTAGTNKKIWWQCEFGHEWQAPGSPRTKGVGCPVCSSRIVVVGINDLASTHPELAVEWHPSKNGELTPQDVVAGTHSQLFWICEHGHDWRASGADRTSGKGCPVCVGRVVVIGFNDLASTHPELAVQWHPTKNSNLTAEKVVAGTSRQIWWQCEFGHEWQTGGDKRIQGRGCPTCATYGFDPSSPAIFYFIERLDLGARKVGITNAGTDRLMHFNKSKWNEVLLIENQSGLLIRKLESAILSWLRVDLGLAPHLGKAEMGSRGGWSETFGIQGPTNDEVIERIQHEYSCLENESKSSKDQSLAQQEKTGR